MKVDLDALKARVPLEELIGRVVTLKAKRAGEWWGCCPFHGERTPSFKVDRRGFFRCFGCDEKGDHLTWLMQSEGLDFVGALGALQELAGGAAPAPAGRALPAPAVPADDEEDRRRRRDHALAIWHEAKPAGGTPVAAYLAGRGIRLAPPPTLRFHPALRHPDAGADLPAMVAAMTVEGPDLLGLARSRVVAVHRTWIDPHGRGKAKVERAKMMLGAAAGAAIRLAPAGPVLAVSEGIETGLSVMQACPEVPVWAAGSLGAIAGAGLGEGRRRPDRPDRRLPSETPDLARPGIVLPPVVREVVILADADGDRLSQSALIERAVQRWRRQGLIVRVAWPRAGGDFNDMLGRAA